MKLDSVIFFTNNLNQSVHFYVEVIGLELEYQQGDAYASLLFENGVRLGIKSPTDIRETPGSQTLFIKTGNISILYQSIQDKGVDIYTELKQKDYGSEFSILDPDGNKVLFIKRT